MPSSAAWVQKLIDAAHDIGIKLSERDLQTIANASPDSRLAGWARETTRLSLSLKETELSSPDEISTSRGDTHKDEASIISGNDEDLQEATRSIRASTAAIRSQMQIIENQTNIITALGPSQVPDSNAYQRLASKAGGQTHYIKSVNEDKARNLARELQADLDQLDGDRKLHMVTASQRLNADDRALGLLHISDKPEDQVSNWAAETLARVEQLSRALIDYRVATVKDRLDSTYLEHLQRHLESDSAEPSESIEPIEQLKLETRSLYTEIEDVATMVVSHEHTVQLNALLGDIAASQTEAEQQAYSQLSSSWGLSVSCLTYVQAMSQLRQLTGNMESLRDGLITNDANREITLRMIQHLDAIEAHRQEHLSQVQQQGVSDREADPDAAAVYLARRLRELDLEPRRQQHMDQDPSQRFTVLTKAFSKAAERRNTAIQSLSSAFQQHVSPNTDLRQLESEINESRAKFEELTAPKPT